MLVPTGEFVQKLIAARLAADVMGVPTIIVARTDANGASFVQLEKETSMLSPRQSLEELPQLLLSRARRKRNNSTSPSSWKRRLRPSLHSSSQLVPKNQKPGSRRPRELGFFVWLSEAQSRLCLHGCGRQVASQDRIVSYVSETVSSRVSLVIINVSSCTLS